MYFLTLTDQFDMRPVIVNMARVTAVYQSVKEDNEPAEGTVLIFPDDSKYVVAETLSTIEGALQQWQTK